MADTPGQRVYLVRVALGRGHKNPMLIKDFVVVIQRLRKVSYDPSAISRLENGDRLASLEDIEAIAAVDPLRRGKLWLAWGEDQDSAKEPLDIDPTALIPQTALAKRVRRMLGTKKKAKKPTPRRPASNDH